MKFAEHLFCQAPPDATFYTNKLFPHYLKITWLSAHINKIPSQHLQVQSYNKKRQNKKQNMFKVKKDTWATSTVCSCQLTCSGVFFVLDLFYAVW